MIAIGSEFSADLFLEAVRAVHEGIEKDGALDQTADPEKDEQLVGSANGGGKLPVQTPVQETAVDVKRVEAVLNSEELIDQLANPLRFSILTSRGSRPAATWTPSPSRRR